MMKKIKEFLLLDRLFSRLGNSLYAQLFALFIVSVVLFYGAVLFFDNKIPCFESFYGLRLRGFLFSGFLTVGSFLLSLMTFVVVNLKDKLFDSDAYKNTYIIRNRLKDEKDIIKSDFYKPLASLTGFLFLSILFSIATAVSQFSLGLIDNVYYSLFCIWLGLFTILLLLNCLRLIRKNILIWLGYK